MVALARRILPGIGLSSLALALSGCGARSGQVGEPRQAPPASYALRYVLWSGVSPGAGFTSTSLDVVEIDLGARRARRLRTSASVPEPMLPRDERGVSELLRATGWVSLSSSQAEKLDDLIRAWLRTRPPPRYKDHRVLGREDASFEKLSIAWGAGSVSTEMDLRAGVSPDDPLRPSKEWRELILAIRMSPLP